MPRASTPRTITLRLPTPRGYRAAALAVLLLIWPLIGNPFTLLGDAIQACIILVVTVSLVLLTGWVGQISLAQATFVGIGAFTTGILSRQLGVPFPLNLLGAGIVAGGAAGLLGVVALRVRGLYLAVATLIFAWMADEWLFNSSWLVGAGGSSSVDSTVIGRPDAIPRFDLSDRRALYYVVLAVAAAALYIAANLRDSKTGRALFAVRGSEMAAASLGIDIRRYKLLAFAVSGFLAGVAGNLIMTGQRSAVPGQFTFTFSLFYLAVAVVGGLSSLGGAVASSVMFALLAELFFRVRALAGWLEIVSAALLAVVLLVYPGGLAAVPQSFARPLRTVRARLEPLIRALLIRLRLDRGQRDVGPTDVLAMPVVDDEPVPVLKAGARLDQFDLPPDRDDRRPVLEAEGVIVQFGGLRAVDDVSVKVCEGEIVGLIGPNGAGKTTTFNAIAGLNVPTAGTVKIFGEDVTNLPVHDRAKLGVARTFQVIQLFPQLTVFENLLVATHLQNRSTVADHIIVTSAGLRNEEIARRRVRRVIKLLNLEEVSDRRIAGLPFGVLRMVEVARAVVTGAPLIMLDEPASGLDNIETDRLADLLFFLRGELGVSILLIEHDVRMVTGVSDYLYVINRGQPLADGFPADVVRDEGVIAAYLGQAPTEAGVG
jgi:branched-chain amino acid transport system permease protein